MPDAPALFAFLPAARGGGTDAMLWAFAHTLMSAGLRVRGCVQRNPQRERTERCDMVVLVLGSGREFQISQDRGPGARGCRLDAGALELAVAEVEVTIADGADVLIVNKFGKHEADGRGFCPVIGDALARGIPVLAAVNALNRPAFDTFADGLAEELTPSVDALAAWASRVIVRD